MTTRAAVRAALAGDNVLLPHIDMFEAIQSRVHTGRPLGPELSASFFLPDLTRLSLFCQFVGCTAYHLTEIAYQKQNCPEGVCLALLFQLPFIPRGLVVDPECVSVLADTEYNHMDIWATIWDGYWAPTRLRGSKPYLKLTEQGLNMSGLALTWLCSDPGIRPSIPAIEMKQHDAMTTGWSQQIQDHLNSRFCCNLGSPYVTLTYLLSDLSLSPKEIGSKIKAAFVALTPMVDVESAEPIYQEEPSRILPPPTKANLPNIINTVNSWGLGKVLCRGAAIRSKEDRVTYWSLTFDSCDDFVPPTVTNITEGKKFFQRNQPVNGRLTSISVFTFYANCEFISRWQCLFRYLPSEEELGLPRFDAVTPIQDMLPSNETHVLAALSTGRVVEARATPEAHVERQELISMHGIKRFQRPVAPFIEEQKKRPINPSCTLKTTYRLGLMMESQTDKTHPSVLREAGGPLVGGEKNPQRPGNDRSTTSRKQGKSDH